LHGKLGEAKNHRGITMGQDKFLRSSNKINSTDKTPTKFHSINRTREKGQKVVADSGTFMYSDGKFKG